MDQQSPSTSDTTAEILEAFLDPITQEVMQDPVMTTLGHTYDRHSIEEWLRNHNTDPMTNEMLPSKQLIPNHALRGMIQSHLEMNPSI